MSGRVHRLLRKQAGELTQRHAQIIAPAVNAALQNEELTRKRVDAIEEAEAGRKEAAARVEAILQPLLKAKARTRRRLERLEAIVGQPTLSGRLRWLLLGR